MKIYFTFLFILLFYTINAQSVRYKNYKYDWPTQKPAPIKLDSAFKNEDAVILEETCIYNEGGNRVPQYYFLNISANYFFVDASVQGVSPVVKKYQRIKFLTQKGIDKFSRFVLPESFDPPEDYYNVRPDLREKVFRPLGEFECIRFFVARIIKPDGTTKEVSIKDKTREEILRGATVVEKFYNWIFQVGGIEIGDELEMDFSYEGVFNYGFSNRIFFNEEMPIQKLDFTFRYPEKDLFILTYHNGALPHDSVMITPSSPHYTEYYFHFDNLRGGINEPGGRPYTQLPYFTFYEHRRDYGIEDPKSKFISTPLPYPWTYILLPFAGYKYENLKMRLARTDLTTTSLNNFTDKAIERVHDTTSALVMSEVQRNIAENFEFKEDAGYYLGEALDVERLGKNIENKTLRQMSRERIYDEVMMRLEKPYFHSLLTDKRISNFDMMRYESTIASRMSIAVPYQNYILHFYPKSYRFGYEPNELPFYYEDINSVLVPQNQPSEKQYQLIPNIEFKFIKTPSSDQANNTRNTAGKISISLDSLKVNIQARIRLSGQFSTLTRGYYKFGSIDTTINPAYFNIISQMADDSEKVKNTFGEVENKFPFTVSVNQEFTSDNHLKKVNEKEFELSLDHFFNNIVDENVKSKNRLLNYYPDFKSQDLHRYMLHFDHPVEVTNSSAFKNSISNSFTDYEIKISQPTENDVLLEESYSVKAEYVLASAINDVETVFNAIHSANSNALKVRRKD